MKENDISWGRKRSPEVQIEFNGGLVSVFAWDHFTELLRLKDEQPGSKLKQIIEIYFLIISWRIYPQFCNSLISRRLLEVEMRDPNKIPKLDDDEDNMTMIMMLMMITMMMLWCWYCSCVWRPGDVVRVVGSWYREMPRPVCGWGGTRPKATPSVGGTESDSAAVS